MSSDAALLKEIERLSGAINRHKTGHADRPTAAQPYYKPSTSRRELVINGESYASSKRKLVRKDAPPLPRKTATPIPAITNAAFPPSHRVYKPKPVVSYKRRRRNRTLKSSAAAKNRATKQCRFFSITGICGKGRTCPYLHDPDRVAICPRFLQRECPLDGDTCPLSHNPTPERVPLCVHFANHGRCKNGDACLYPHVHVGKREGVCRDFAVLGYCGKGIDCDKQHIRECPDFAETGRCLNRSCKLPHVIRANRKRSAGSTLDSALSVTAARQPDNMDVEIDPADASISPGEEEFIPLTFHESSDDEDSGSDDSEDDDDESH